MVCVGRLCEQKGQLLLVEAVSLLAKKGLNFELVLAGDGEMRPEIEALIQERQLQDKVTITGWISSDQVREEILASRALVLPSFAEGLACRYHGGNGVASTRTHYLCGWHPRAGVR